MRAPQKEKPVFLPPHSTPLPTRGFGGISSFSRSLSPRERGGGERERVSSEILKSRPSPHDGRDGRTEGPSYTVRQTKFGTNRTRHSKIADLCAKPLPFTRKKSWKETPISSPKKYSHEPAARLRRRKLFSLIYWQNLSEGPFDSTQGKERGHSTYKTGGLHSGRGISKTATSSSSSLP